MAPTSAPTDVCDFSGDELFWGEIDFGENVSNHCSNAEVAAVQNAAQLAVDAINSHYGSSFELQAPQDINNRRDRGLRGEQRKLSCSEPWLIEFGLCRRRRLEEKETEHTFNRELLTGTPCPEAVTLFLHQNYFPHKLTHKKNQGVVSQECYDFVNNGFWDFDAYVQVE